MTTQLTFLGWDAPPIQSLCNWLLKHAGTNSVLDLSNKTIVLPSASGIKHLQQALVEETTSRNLAILPPKITTVGGLPEQLYPHKPPASESFQHLAWVSAIRDVAINNGLKTLLPAMPARQNHHAWQQIAKTIATVHRELYGEGLAFSDMVDHCQRQGASHETLRWQELQLVQDAYFALLDQHKVWDLQSARVIALKNNELSVESSRRFVVAGCTDLSATFRGFLAAISNQTEFIVFSPQQFAHGFDDVGCLIPAEWDATIPSVPVSQVQLASDPNHQCELVLDTITGLPEDVTSCDILITTPDANDEKQIVRQLHRHDVAATVPTGQSLSDTKPVVLVQGIRDYLADSNFDALSNLLRHPDVSNYILPNKSITATLRELTQYHEERLPLNDSDIRSLAKRYPALASAVDRIHDWTKTLNQVETAFQCHDALINLLTAVYGELTFDRETDISQINSIKSIAQHSIELATAYDQLEQDVTLIEFLTQLLESLDSLSIPPTPKTDAITISGWLDAPWSTQPYVILTSVNEGIIPTTSNTELFIQDETRIALGLLNNQRRLARDAYALALLRHSRNLTVISKRTTYQGDPLPISRLLLHGPIEQQARLVKQFSSGEVTMGRNRLNDLATIHPLSPLEVEISPYKPESISVTSLRSYLSCPLRYYLAHVLRLKSTEDSSRELSPLTFGNLVHNVLYQFGVSECKNSIDKDEIFEFLKTAATKEFRRNYGKSGYPAVRLQLEQIYLRLSAFASWQARWRADGWVIQEVEYNAPEPVPVLEDYPECKIHGRIDRIDYHPAKSTYAIFDYKTSESSDSPEASHKSSRPPGWSDLQLPMYRHLARGLTKDASILLGYISLGKELGKVGAQFATWDEATLLNADQTAVDVIRAIHNGDFSELSDNIDVKFDNYAELLGRTTLDHPGVKITGVSS